MTIETTIPLLSRLRFEPIASGYFKGVFAIQAKLEDLPATPEQIVKVIFDGILATAKPVRRKIFRLFVEGEPSSETQTRIESLCAALVDYGFQIQVVFDGKHWFRALQGANWIVVKTSEPFVAFGGNELWYIAEEGKRLDDPTAPIRADTPLYLQAKGRSESEVLEFLSRSKYNWNML